MRHRLLGFFSALVLGLAIHTGARAQEGEAAAIRSVIEAQIDAFRADDFAAAFEFASPGIRQMFGTADRFGDMVRQGYPMVWRPASVEFLDLREIGGRLWQVVLMRDDDGAYHTLGYQMDRTPEGGWQIDGVQILRGAEMGA